MPVIDLRSLTETEREREVRDRIKAEAERQFDFSAGLFLRAVLLQISNDQHILILTTHHIVADAWSMGILTQELWTLYDAYANGRPSPLQEELPIQYADYAFWQREWLQGDVLESQLSYWKEQLKELPVLNLPTDHPRPVKQSFRGARQPLSLPEALTKAVNELSRREGVTQFMTLLAAFQVLLCRYSGQEDIVVGSPIANRNRTEVEGVIGFFVNTLVLRADLSGKPTFKEVLQHIRDVCLDAYAHQDLPFEKLVEELQPERDLSRNPLFQVMFILQNGPRRVPNLSGISFARMDIDSKTSKFDLMLSLRERDGKLIGFLEYSTDLFDSSTIERMFGHFRTLLEGIVADPDQPISKLPLLTQAEKHQLLVGWNDTAADYPKESCIHGLFETQVERTPEAIAVQFEGEKLTYRELNSRANQLAHYLQGLGVGLEKLVGICVERSLEMVIGLLGILKAGGAYVPLDPAYPSERLGFMLQDSQCSFLLTQQSTVEDRRWEAEDGDSPFSILDPQIKVVCLDTDWETIARESDQNPRSEVNPNNLAYVIYTSGSIGKPKGVMISHRAVCNHIDWGQTIFLLNHQDRVVQKTSLSFDASVWEIFAPLLTGARLVIARPRGHQDSRYLIELMHEQNITILKLVPSLLQMLLEEEIERCTSLRHVLCGGETLPVKLQKRFYDRSNASLHNLYGPTEATIDATFWTCNGENCERSVPIGRPINNMRIYVLDPNLEPVPIGVAGELHIGGDGIARGYLNRTELSLEKFIPNPFIKEPQARLYKTGDLVRYRPDGNIEFLGRADNQVKLRGYRIELGEIETVLNEHPAVKYAVVVLHERDSSAEKSLVSYVLPRRQSTALVPGLRNFLERKLPEYMIPSVFVILEALPLSPNGKVDRQQLPQPDHTRPQLAARLVAPRTEIQELIAQIWREILKVKNLDIHDNFFEVGGHSLLAVQVVSRLREAFNREIPLRVLFESPTIYGLASCIEGFIRGGRAPDLPPILPILREGPLPLSINQEHLWHLDQMIPGTHFFNIPYAYRLTGELNIDALEKALKEIIRRHEALRTVFGEVNGRPVQIIKHVIDFNLPCLDLRGQAVSDLAQAAADLILKERQQPFNLAVGPLIRTKLLQLTHSDYLLLITLHHIISDHWSMLLLRREVVALYRAFSQGQRSPLPEPAIQFADFACWERRLLENGFLSEHIRFWKKQLGASRPQLKFEKNGGGKKHLSFRTSRQSIELEENLFAGIKAVAKRENCTPFMLLAAALNILLYSQTGRQDIRIGTLVANRGRNEVEGTIGYFANSVILRNKLSPKMTAKRFLDQVRKTTVAAFAHEELPFEELARTLERLRNVKRDLLFQVLLMYRNSTLEPFTLPGLTFASFPMQHIATDPEFTITGFDLILNLREASTKLTGALTWKTDVLRNTDVPRMIHCFAKILELMVTDLDRPINTILVGIQRVATLTR